jgi:hypothetical protein
MSYRLVWPTLHLFDYFDLLVLAGFVVATFWRSGVASYQAALVVMLILRFSHVLRTFTPVIVATFLFALLTELFIKRSFTRARGCPCIFWCLSSHSSPEKACWG